MEKQVPHKNILSILKSLCFIFLFLEITAFSTISYAVPFTITPKSQAVFMSTFSIPTQGSHFTVYYTVKNNTGSQRNNNYVKHLPPHVTQVASGGTFNDTCGATFNLAPSGQTGDSCTLQLRVSGPVNINDPDPHHHLFVCFPGGTTCAGTFAGLNVVEGRNDLARVAVGTYTQTNQFPIAFVSDDGGNSWVNSTLQLIEGAPYNDFELRGVSCAGNNGLFCTAVGYYRDAGAKVPVFRPVAYFSRDGGYNFSLSLVQPPFYGAGDNVLFAVSCGGSDGLTCAAVGYYSTDPVNAGNVGLKRAHYPMTYFSKDGGNTWSVSTGLPNRQGVGGSHLRGVSCNGLLCSAVGIQTARLISGEDNEFQRVSYTSQDGGNTWLPSTILPPEGITGSEFYSVSCRGNNGLLCSSVGSTQPASGPVYSPLAPISQDGGKTWGLPSITPATQGNTVLFSISCEGNNGLLCSAVGRGIGLTDTTRPASYISRDGGNTWFVSLLQPFFQGGTSLVPVYSVVCRGDNGIYCTTVGAYGIFGSNLSPASYISPDGGNTWAISAVQPTKRGSTTTLYAVS